MLDNRRFGTKYCALLLETKSNLLIGEVKYAI